MQKRTVIAVSGKGGTGKTIVAALLVKILTGNSKSILAIDADPDSNLPEALGVEVKGTVGGIREKLLSGRDQIPPGVVKRDLLEYQIMEILTETPNFDLLVMGRPEGPGCYCAVNHLLREIIDTFAKNYDVVVIDTEAGLEHLSRRTTRDVDTLLVVTDPTKRGLMTAKRIKDLVKELNISINKIYVIANRVTEPTIGPIKKSAAELGLTLIGIIPEDQNITQFDLNGRPIIELSPNSPALKSIAQIAQALELF
ncbi:MAG: AAA family ATPase [Euryarchaeota archaeon]|nr:AAA family ATPase [Euryarchaeota archaeon]